ncbi:MAG: SDR family oxidoreductase [Chloroflexi bacterium]|nr:SDR family oxidoreductase [Chloroflexota bacterium]MCY4246138.1 SDR family oxidoreductase [Chloroflexota bacterium]
MPRIFITGANRGIGFELARQYAAAGDALVFAGCRKPADAAALNELAEQAGDRLVITQLDVNDAQSITAATERIAARAGALDILINNAGINPRGAHQSSRMGNLFAADVSEVITTNAVGALIVTQACRALLGAGDNPRVVMISSGMGSMQRARGDSYAYRMSKAAMNMAARVLAFDEAMGGITTVTVNPGWVRTDMGGANAALDPEVSGSGLRALIGGLTPDDKGKFYQYDSSELPW